ncbi:hypothetical protein [Telmatospirillum sp.]|uniref:hypothetical protein n=1 Tax=Telmatospirillum sp. TaxID=2079197 RepID=UPI00283FAC52|nr:hypothetical protein [Telmatospirillum sp.]MDR3440897.1 hypothetical protein [Telmatospirillum sp.]
MVSTFLADDWDATALVLISPASDDPSNNGKSSLSACADSGGKETTARTPRM